MEAFKKVARFFAETGKTIIVSLVIVYLIRSFIVQPFYVRGASMTPTFEDGEYLIINEVGYACMPFTGTSYCIGKPERGDVIVFRYPLDPSDFFIKRIIGLPGDIVEIDNGKVFVNKAELDESYLPRDIFTYGKTITTLGESEYYVLGDNRPSSSDSRRWGKLPRGNIVGKVWLRGWPPGRIGIVSSH